MLSDDRWKFELSELDWMVFETLVADDHPLRLALERIPWEEFRAALDSYYCKELGQPSIDPVLMFKLEYLRYYYRLSDRQVIARAETDIAIRYFLQIRMRACLPDPSSLSRFRGRLGAEGFAKVFQKLVAVAREQGVVKDRLRLKDASHVIANIAVPTTLGLLAQARDRLLSAAAPWDADAAEGHRINIELLRERTDGLPADERLAARAAHVQDLLAWAEGLAPPEDAAANRAWQRLVKLCETVRKILYDQENPDAGRRTLSTVDPEARRGKHGDWFDGFKLDIMMDADSGLITELNTLEAGGDEAKSAVEMVEREQQTHGNQIEAISIDGAGFNGEMLQALEKPDQQPGVTVYVPPKKQPESDLFPASDFVAAEDRSYVTCPAGERSHYRQRDERNRGVKYRFTRNQCLGCPLLVRCVGRLDKQRAFGRTVTKSDYAEDYDRARARAKTEAYAAVRREHPAIERKLNEVLNHHGGRRAVYWGRAKVHIRECMACFTVNVKRLVKLQSPEVRATAALECGATA